MAVSPDRLKCGLKLLYASNWGGVILAVVAAICTLGSQGWAQYAKKATASKGPRALGLLELAVNGKAHLLPIVILYEGQYYDASSYKAAPVPMALDSGTVYEGTKTGVSQGLFTISGALHSDAGNRWVGAGTWQPAGSEPAKKAAPPQKKSEEDLNAPPVLRRPGAETKKPAEPPAAAKVPTPAPAAAPAQANPPTPAPVEKAPPEDPDRPVLRRGQQTPGPAEMPGPSAAKGAGTKVAEAKSADPAPSSGPVQEIPAISDAKGPEPHSYADSTKPEDEQNFRKKMLTMAVTELQNYQKTAVEPGAAVTKKPVRAARPVPPNFEDVQLRILDLSTSNEPILVLMAKALPTKATATPDLQYFITLVAREDIYGDLHRASVKITDTQHFDSLPRFELIDAVDADGDGRGELLFRQISDAGRAFVIYRVIGDQLWPLYEGAPQ